MKCKNIVGDFFDNAFIFQIGMNLYIAHSVMSGLIFYKKKKKEKNYFISSSLSSVSQNLVILCNAPKANTFCHSLD